MYPIESMPLPPTLGARGDLAAPGRGSRAELESKPAVQQVFYHGAWHYLMDDDQNRKIDCMQIVTTQGVSETLFFRYI